MSSGLGPLNGENLPRGNAKVRDLRGRDAAHPLNLHVQFASELLNDHSKSRLRAANLAIIAVFAVILVLAQHLEWQVTGTWLIACALALGADFLIRRHAGKAERRLHFWNAACITALFAQGVCFGIAVAFTPVVELSVLETAALMGSGLLLAINAVLHTSALRFGPLALILPVTAGLASHWSSLPTPWLISAAALGTLAAIHGLAALLRTHRLAGLTIEKEREALMTELAYADSRYEAAQKLADDASLSKSRFLATMSHELRTPLNAILGFSEMMSREVLGPMGNSKYRDYAEDIHGSGTRLLGMIDGVLDLSRLEAGRYALDEEPVTLSALIEEAARSAQHAAREKSLAVIVQVQDDLPDLMCDERAVRQVVMNLLSNAIKFTPDSGSITITAGWTHSGGQYIAVCDTGPGIAEDEINAVLAPFSQGDEANRAATPGTGLGLPLVRAFMKLHDGAFLLKPDAKQGTKAVAIFPQTRVMPRQVEEPLSENASIAQVA